MFRHLFFKKRMRTNRAQAAFEYMILLTSVVLLVLLGFHPQNGFLVKAKNLSDVYMNYSLKQTYGRNATDDAGRAMGHKGPFPVILLGL